MQFDRPIPGQSLTTTPKAAPYERPPEITDPTKALDFHLGNLAKDGAMDDIMYFLEKGLDIQTLVEGVLRSAVMEGMHSIDVSLIVGPVLHELIRGTAKRAGVSFKEGFEQEDRNQAIQYERDMERSQKILIEELGGDEDSDLMSLEDAQVDQTEELQEETIPVEQEESQGLMARRA